MFLSPSAPWPGPQTPYEADALVFCRAWQSGQMKFTLHTSGSTGEPKPISLTRAQMRASAHLTGQTLGLGAGDTALVCLNIRYVAGIMMLVRGLELGMNLTIVEPSGNPLANFDPATSRFTFTALVPLQLQTILDDTDPVRRVATLSMLNGMKAILVGGAATSPALERALQVITAPVYATYGMTETVSHIALRRLNGPGQSDFFTSLDGVMLGTDERGCLHITSAATNFECVQTNDVVQLIDATHFRVLGRADTIINSGGVKVQPEAVERIIQDVMTLFESEPNGSAPRLLVAGLPDERLGQRVVLLLENYVVQPNQLTVIQEQIRQRIGPYAIPKQAITVDQFTETPTGKVDRVRTVARYT